MERARSNRFTKKPPDNPANLFLQPRRPVLSLPHHSTREEHEATRPTVLQGTLEHVDHAKQRFALGPGCQRVGDFFAPGACQQISDDLVGRVLKQGSLLFRALHPPREPGLDFTAEWAPRERKRKQNAARARASTRLTGRDGRKPASRRSRGENGEAAVGRASTS